MPTALPYFGGATVAYETVAYRVREARLNAGLTPEDLGALAGMVEPSRVDDLENRRVPPVAFSAAEILVLSAQVGLTVERLLPFRKQLTPEDRAAWEQERSRSRAGPVAAASGATAPDAAPTLELFIRLRALEELFTKPPVRLTHTPTQ